MYVRRSIHIFTQALPMYSVGLTSLLFPRVFCQPHEFTKCNSGGNRAPMIHLKLELSSLCHTMSPYWSCTVATYAMCTHECNVCNSHKLHGKASHVHETSVYRLTRYHKLHNYTERLTNMYVRMYLHARTYVCSIYVRTYVISSGTLPCTTVCKKIKV